MSTPTQRLQPGIISLRPLTLGDVFNGAVAAIRANPWATLGLTTAVVLIAQTISLLLQVGLLSGLGELAALRGDTEFPVAYFGSVLLGAAIDALTTLVLAGLLTIVIARAVFGVGTSIAEAWSAARPRIPALLGVGLLLAGGVLLFLLATGLLVAVADAVAGPVAAGVVALLLGLPLILGLVWLWVQVMFASVAVVLERRGVLGAITRSFALVRGDFWRLLGFRLVTWLVITLVGTAVAFPFLIGGTLAMNVGGGSTAAILVGAALASIGGVIGQIITVPFGAAVIVLLYTDRRMRAEAFDLFLLTDPDAAAAVTSPDDLWLIGR